MTTDPPDALSFDGEAKERASEETSTSGRLLTRDDVESALCGLGRTADGLATAFLELVSRGGSPFPMPTRAPATPRFLPIVLPRSTSTLHRVAEA